MRFHSLLLLLFAGTVSAHAEFADDCARLTGTPALEACDAAIERNPRDVRSLFYRGIAHLQLKERQRAISDFTAAIEIDPSQPEHYYQRAISRVDPDAPGGLPRDLFEAALLDLGTVIRLNTKHDWAYNKRGWLYFASDVDRALSDFDEAARLSPDEPLHVFARGAVFLAKGWTARAMAEFERSNKLAIRSPKMQARP